MLYRKGRVRCSSAFDHDFPSWADGVVIPHGIYDRRANVGHINLGLSHDTTQFACDSFKWFWNRIGRQRYPTATSILLVCDGGGSNSANKYIFKRDLQQLCNEIDVEIRVAHYPPYCSKYNPIERRLFPHVGRACRGMLFESIDRVVQLMRRTRTATGLRTTVNVIRRAYETKRYRTDETQSSYHPRPTHAKMELYHRPTVRTLIIRSVLSRKILHTAHDLAMLLESELHVVHSIASGDTNRELMPNMPADRWNELLTGLRDQAHSHLIELVRSELPDVPESRIHLLPGSATTSIPRYVAANRTGTLVMGSVVRTGISGFLMGNTAERILRQVKCSVLTVKPEGFGSLVQAS